MKFEKLEKLLEFLDLPSTPVIGVDISASSIKMVELSKDRKGVIKLENYSIEPMPKDIITDQGVADTDALGAALKRGWTKLGTKIKKMAIALPGNLVISKKVKMANNLDEIGIADEVLAEAAQFIPFSLDDVYIDWSLLGPHPAHPETDNEVIICATRKDRVIDLMAAAEAAGLEIYVVDIDSHSQQLAMEQLILGNPEMAEEVIAVVDAGSTTLNLSIFNKGNELIFSKEISFGSNQLTDSICQAYDIRPEQAEDAKRRNGAGLEDYQSRVLDPFLMGMGMEINRSIQFYLTTATVEKVDRILLAGGCAAYQGAEEAVGGIVQIQTNVFNPFNSMLNSSKVKNKALNTEAPILLTSCGLAMRRFDA